MNAGARAASKAHPVMKKIALFPLALLLLGAVTLAGDQLRNVQTELKNLGFYYGEVNGQASSETTAAIRRYQIRNGLEVTGTLNQETLAAIGPNGRKSAGPAPAPAARAVPLTPQTPERKAPPVDLRRNDPAEESDRKFLRREESSQRPPDAVAPLAPNRPLPPNDSSVVNPPAPLDAPSPDFPVLFAGTPYADAPLPVQEQTLRRAQSALASQGFYGDVVDGIPGPATEEALLAYQRAQRLILTGRLDLETLAQLRLLPNAANSPRAGFRAPQRAYRGIWINRGLRFGVEFD